MKTFNDLQELTKECNQATDGNIVPEFYFEWGNEPAGFVSVGCYIDEVYTFLGFVNKGGIGNLKFNCPHS